MFLVLLNEKCKESVMDLAIHMAYANKSLEDTEKQCLNQYFYELGIDCWGYGTKYSVDDDIKSVCENTSMIEKKMILFELLAIANSDDIYEESEENLIIKICNAFHININIINEMNQKIFELRSLYKDITNVIGAEENNE